MRVLIAEDEEQLAQAVARTLRRNGFSVDLATDGDSALRKAGVVEYDAIVLDRDLPRLHGDEVCKQLVAAGHPARIIMLTASGELEQVVDGLDLGADDYLVKPVRIAELMARLRAVARRRGAAAASTITCGELAIDPSRMSVERAGRAIELTPREFAVLELLVRAQGQIVSAEALLYGAWDENADPFTASVRVILSRLRRKLGDPPVIHTVVGRGYHV